MFFKEKKLKIYKYFLAVFIFFLLIFGGFGLGFSQKDFKPGIIFLSQKWGWFNLGLANASNHFSFLLLQAENCREIVLAYGELTDSRISVCVSAFRGWEKWGFERNDDFHPLWLTWLYWKENPDKQAPLTFDGWARGASGMLNSWKKFMSEYEEPLDDIRNPCHDITLYYSSSVINTPLQNPDTGWRNYSSYYESCEEKFNKFSEYEYDDPEHPLYLFWEQWNTDQSWETDDGQQNLIPPPIFSQWEIGAGLLAESEWNFTRQPFFSSLPGFGGRVASVMDCTCDETKLFYLTPVPGSWSGPYLVRESTDLHPVYGPVSSGRWVLGNVNSGGSCMMTSNTGCYPIPTMFKVQPRPAGVGASQ